MTLRVSVMVSRRGSLLQTHIDSGLPLDLVIADRHCDAVHNVALAARVQAKIFTRSFKRGHFNRERYSRNVRNFLINEKIEVVILAGFGTIFHPIFFRPYKRKSLRGCVVNIHPSLLPSFKGSNAVQDALDAGVEHTGCTFHIARVKYDTGPVLHQCTVPILEGDTKKTLHARINAAEQKVYPEVVADFLRSMG